MQSAHLALIDGLMAVGAMETVAAVKKQGSDELLGGACSWEDALLHWVDQVGGARRDAHKHKSVCLKHVSVPLEYSWFTFSILFTTFPVKPEVARKNPGSPD